QLWDLRAPDPSQSSTSLANSEQQARISADGRWLVTHGSEERRTLGQQIESARRAEGSPGDVSQRQDLARALMDLQKRQAGVALTTELWDLSADAPAASRRALAN